MLFMNLWFVIYYVSLLLIIWDHPNLFSFYTSYCGHMLVCHLVSDSPPHVHNLKKGYFQESFELWIKFRFLLETQVHVAPCSIPWSLGKPTPSRCFSPSACQWKSSWWICGQPNKQKHISWQKWPYQNTENLWTERWQIVKTAGKNVVHRLFIPWCHPQSL